MQHHIALARFERLELLVVANDAALLAQVIGQRFRDLVVEEGQQAVVGIDQRHLGAEVDEDRCVLAADHTGAVDRHGERMLGVAQDRIAVADALVSEIDFGRMIGTRARGDDDVACPRFACGLPVGRLHFERVRIDELRLAPKIGTRLRS